MRGRCLIDWFGRTRQLKHGIFNSIPSGSKTIRNDRANLPLKFPRDDVSHMGTCSVNYRLFTTEMCSRVKRGRRKQVSYDASRNIKERGTLEPDNRPSVRPRFLRMQGGARRGVEGRILVETAGTGESNGQKNIYARSTREC